MWTRLGQKQEAFAALLGDGSVVCWGSERLGGNSAEVKERDLHGASWGFTKSSALNPKP